MVTNHWHLTSNIHYGITVFTFGRRVLKTCKRCSTSSSGNFSSLTLFSSGHNESVPNDVCDGPYHMEASSKESDMGQSRALRGTPGPCKEHRPKNTLYSTMFVRPKHSFPPPKLPVNIGSVAKTWTVGVHPSSIFVCLYRHRHDSIKCSSSCAWTTHHAGVVLATVSHMTINTHKKRTVPKLESAR